MDILMSETCWAHNKWNKITSDIKLVFHSSKICALIWLIAKTILRGTVSKTSKFAAFLLEERRVLPAGIQCNVYCNIFYFSKLVYNLLEFPPTHKLIKLLPININEFPPPTQTHTHTHTPFLYQQFLAGFTTIKLWSKIFVSGKRSKLAGIKIKTNCHFN